MRGDNTISLSLDDVSMSAGPELAPLPVQTMAVTVANQVFPARVRTVMVWPLRAVPLIRAPQLPFLNLVGVAVMVAVLSISAVGVLFLIH